MAKKPARAAKKTFTQRSRDVGAEQKAIYHQVAGAGKGRVVRSFFDLTDDDADAIVARIDTHLATVTRAS